MPPKPIHLKIFSVQSGEGKDGVMVLGPDDVQGQPRFLWSDELLTLKARSAVLSDQASHAVTKTGVDEELGALGDQVRTAAYPTIADDVSRDALVYLRAQGDPKATWMLCEDVVWEALCARERFLIDRDIAVVRGYGDAAIGPIHTERRAIRVLILCANPVGAQQARLDVGGALAGLHRAWSSWVIRPEVKTIQGPGTRDALRKLADEDDEWDIIHVVAHGSRDSQSIQLELGGDGAAGDHGRPDWCEFDAFARLLGKFKTPRLITLCVCDSSPLALELMEEYRGETRVAALLARGAAGSMLPFFTELYAHLFVATGKPAPGADIFVEEAYVAAVQHLRRRKLAQWFLPVLYAPATARPLFAMPAVECDLRETLDTIVARWDSDQDVNAGLVVLEGRFKDENRAAGQRAEELCQAIRKLRDVETTFDQMVTEILERRPWSAVHEQWAGLPVAIEHDFHPEAVPLDTTVIGSFDVLRRTLERLERLAGVAVAALERLAAFEGGDVPALTDGCRRLQEVFCAEAENQPDFPRQVFEEGVVTLLAECEPAEEGAEPCPEALSIVAQVLHLLDESGEAFLAPAQAEALRGRAMALAARLAGQRAAPLLARIGEAIAHVGRTGSPLEQAESARTAAAVLAEVSQSLASLREHAPEGDADLRKAEEQALDEAGEKLRAAVRTVRDRLAAIPIPQAGLPQELLEPGHRLDLCLWLRERRQDAGESYKPLDDIPEEPSALAEYAEALAGEISAAAARGPACCPAAMLSLVANEEAPIVLVADAESATHPYLCLYRFGVRFGTDTAAMRELSDPEVAEETDEGLEKLLHQAVVALSNDRRRLAVDIHVVPSAEPEALTRRLQETAAGVLAGRQGAEPDLAALQPMDQATLLAAAGHAERAADLAWEAVREQPTNGTRIHHAFLLAVHHAATALDDPARFPDAARRVFGLHGMLTVVTDDQGTRYLERFIFQRCTVYGRALSPELTEQLEAVSAELRKTIEQLLTAYARRSAEAAREANLLGAEWQAETEGARAATERRIRIEGHPLGAGYLAAQRLGYLQQVGAFIHGAFGQLSTADETQRLRYVTLTGMTPEACERLIYLFSDFRLAEAEQGEEAVALLKPLTPDAQDLPNAVVPPGVAEAAQAPDFAERFPVHACLPDTDQQQAVLAAHAALVMVKVRLAETRRLLSREGVGLAEVIRHLDRVMDLAHYVTFLGYDLTNPIRSTQLALERMLLNWLYSIQKRLNELNEKLRSGKMSVGEETDREVARLESELRMADHFANRQVLGIGRGDYGTAVNQVHANFAVFLANRFDRHKDALTHIRKAYRGDPDNSHIVVNFVRACGLHALDLKRAGDHKGAYRLLREALREGRQFLERHPEAKGDDMQKLTEELEEIESLLTDRDERDEGPKTPPPALGWVPVDIPDDE